jgi:acyl-CoA thioester hydrolase
MSALTTQLTLRIDWSEMDLYGHVNNVSFFKYIQAARVNFWEEAGINQLHRNSNIGPTLASVNCRFLHSLYFPGEVIIHTHVEWIKTSSFQLIHKLFNTAGEQVARAEDIVVLFDYNTQQKTEVPETIRTAIQPEEKEQ